MGESGEFNSGNYDYTEVYWNMDDYPIAAGIDDLGSIGINIVEALDRFGFHGDKDISVHCKRLECGVMEMLRKAGICYIPESTRAYMKSAAVNKVTLDMTVFLLQGALNTDPMNVAVIAKPNVELVRVLKCLKSKGHTLVLIDPPDDEQCLFSVESLLGSAHLIASDSKEEEEEEEDLSKGEEEEEEEDEEDLSLGEEDPSDVDVEEEDHLSLDTFVAIRPIPVKEAMTPIFWDAEDCPFPPCSTPDEIYHSITSALLERGYSDKVTIWAYLDDDKKGSWRDALLGDKTWASRIYFLPTGDKASRRIRMANDILFWAWESPCKPFQETLLLVSDQFRGDPYYVELLHNLLSANLDIFFVTPTQDINKPESPEWPGLLLDEGAYRLLLETIDIPDEPCRKKRKADAGVLYILEAEEETSDMDYSRLLEPWPAGLLVDGGASCCPCGDETSQSSEGSGLRCLPI